MFVDRALHPRGAVPAQAGHRVRWSVLVPFFNERDCLDTTLESLAAQTVRPRVILIDNASTDGSAAIASATCHRLELDYELLTEPRPGKVAALALGLTRVATPYVATCDADTWYPPHYLAEAQRILERGNAVAGAFFVPPTADARTRRREARRIAATAMLLRGQCHTGGAGQAFRTEALRRAGGFDPHRWGYVLEDHEVIHRVMKHGSMRYAYGLWCCPSPRERDRASIRWTLAERLLYCVAAPVAGDWFFYRFLATRLRARRLTSERIRERQFQDVGRIASPLGANPYPVR
ncbi:glycosyltransferase [Sphingomonas bacterium]|uniref:glycosyltransferase n=1 Tax=Sphingomonas bacterium TaxID=1895847 RepID=UPI001575DFE3|nr:glycosyltransferase family A protein [Sphingomonas bacterium]